MHHIKKIAFILGYFIFFYSYFSSCRAEPGPPSAQTMMNVGQHPTGLKLFGIAFCVYRLYNGIRYRYTTEHVITSGEPEAVYL